jgi:hypothetical protein
MAAVAALVAPTTAGGQELAERVAAAGNATVRIAYAARPDVEICHQGIRMGRNRVWWRSVGSDDEPSGCRTGTVEVELDVRDGDVRGVEVVRREADRTETAQDLGRVSAGAAATFFLDVARGGSVGRRGGDPILPAVLADVEDLWLDLMEIARDRDVRQRARKSALFWVGQEAAEAATEGLADVAFDEDEEQDVRDAAVFALSRRPADEAVPLLIELARTAEQAETRRSAMFWLAQSEDERVLAFFREILSGRGGG